MASWWNLAAVTLAGRAVLGDKSALLIIDVQECFLEGGSLAVPASHIVPRINSIMADKMCLFDEVVYTQDYHPTNHISFGPTHGLEPFSHFTDKGALPIMCISPESGLSSDGACCPTIYVDPASVDCSSQLCPPDGWNYDVNNSGIVENNTACTQCAANASSCFETSQAMWTEHCLQTGDSTFPASLTMPSSPHIVQKGINQFVDAYSGFMDNTATTMTGLNSLLQSIGITQLYVAGIATDVCVQWTVRDALDKFGYEVIVISDATEAVAASADSFASSIDFMRDRGATIVTTDDVLAMQCPPTATWEPDMDKGAGLAVPSVLVLALAFHLWF